MQITHRPREERFKIGQSHHSKDACSIEPRLNEVVCSQAAPGMLGVTLRTVVSVPE
jgi:hypothetical protein